MSTQIASDNAGSASTRAPAFDFDAIFEHSVLGMGRLRLADARWVDVNPALCQMVWRPRGEMLATPLSDMTHPDDVELDAMQFQRMADGQLDSYSVEKRLLHATGQIVWVKLTLSLARDADGLTDYAIAIVDNVRDRKTLELDIAYSRARLHEADRRNDAFLALLAHELRNPLAPIASAADMLEILGQRDPKVGRIGAVLGRQTRHLTALVDNLLDVSRVTCGLVALEKEAVDLGAVVQSALDQSKPLFESRGHELALDVDGARAEVLGDRNRLVQVVANLLDNAARYTPEGGRIALAVRTGADCVIVEVEDNGIGIDASLLPRVFELFAQPGGTPERVPGGLGVGLALARSLVWLHGGEIAAHSAGPGAGSRFTVTLPLAPD